MFTFCLFVGAAIASAASAQGGLLGIFNLGQAGIAPPRQATVGDLTGQGIGLLNYFGSLRRSPKSEAPRRDIRSNLLGLPNTRGSPDAVGFPNIQFLEGVPVVPGVVGSFPGVGECLPQGLPFVNPVSPSLFQNMLRSVPGVQDVLRSLTQSPDVNVRALMGKWHWVVSTATEHRRHCAVSEYKGLKRNAASDAAAFTVVDKFREGDALGSPKIGFGYGLKNKQRVSVYSQSDPCPYQIVAVGPVDRSGQYDYVILSNWAKYPVIGMIRDMEQYGQYQAELRRVLEVKGYINFFTQATGSIQFLDWSQCTAQSSNQGKVFGHLLNEILFG